MINCFKISLLILFIVPLAGLSAQKISIKGGYSAPSVHIHSLAYHIPNSGTKKLPAYHIGGSIEIPIYSALSIEGSLLYSVKGFGSSSSIYKIESPMGTFSGIIDSYTRFIPAYLEMPLFLKATHKTKWIDFYGKAGPYMDIGIGGSIRERRMLEGSPSLSFEDDIQWDSDETDLNRHIYGLMFGAGVQAGVYQFEVSYGQDLTSFASNEYTDLRFNTIYLSLSLILHDHKGDSAIREILGILKSTKRIDN